MQSDFFEWDDRKAQLNFEKHGLSFYQAIEVFDDPNAMTFDDEGHSQDEHRELTVGSPFFDRVFIVAHTRRGQRIRIISARRANKAERKQYMTREPDVIRDRGGDLEDDLLPHYDFDYSKATKGKYYDGQERPVFHVRLDPDVAKHFASGKSVNDALRILIAEDSVPKKRSE